MNLGAADHARDAATSSRTPPKIGVSLAARGPLPSAQLGSFALATEVLVATRKQVFDSGQDLGW